MSSSSGNIIPTVDNFKLLSIDVVKTWPVEDIQRYSTVVGMVILNQDSTIKGNQQAKTQYEKRIIDIDSTIESIDRKIIKNNNTLINYNIRNNFYEIFNREFNSTLASKNTELKKIEGDIAVYDGLVKDIDKSLYVLSVNGDSSLEEAAKYYSSVYIDYIVNNTLYKNYEHSTVVFSSIYESTKIADKKCLEYIQLTADNELRKTIELSTLYNESASIQSSLTQYRIDEVIYTHAYASTTAGLLQVSTLYDTAEMFVTYNNLVSTHTKISENYFNALNNYNIASQNTTGISGATSAGWSNLVSTLLDKDLKLQEQIILTSNAIDTQIANSQMLWIKSSDVAVEIGSQSMSSLTNYMNASDSSLKYYSSMYDDASIAMRISMDASMLYNSYYVSTTIGSNANMNNILQTISTYGNDQTGIDEINARIQVTNAKYTELTSTIMGNIEYSTLMAQEIINANNEFNKYSTLYEIATGEFIKLNSLLMQNESSIYGTIGNMNAESTIMDMENINLRIHDTERDTHLLTGSVQAFKHRELYVVSKQVDAQSYYNKCVLEQVKNNTSSQTALEINNSTINLAYTNLTIIQQFLDTFDSVYVSYENHMQNLLNLSTSINVEKNTYSTFTSYKTLMYLYPNNSTISTSLVSSSDIYIKAKLDSAQSKQNLTPTQSAINIISSDFMNRYVNTFSLSEISFTESTISSIWNEGIQMFSGDISTATIIEAPSFLDTNRIITKVDRIFVSRKDEDSMNVATAS